MDRKNKKFAITIDESPAKAFETIDMEKHNIYNFFTMTQDNTSIVDKIIEVNPNDLIKNKQIEIDYVANLVPRLFCRKLYNYSYEVVDEF